MYRPIRLLLILVVGLVPAAGSADDPAAAGEVAIPVSNEAPQPPDEAPQPLSPLHPRAGTIDGFYAPTLKGDWRGRISVNAWLINEIDIFIDDEHINLGLGWLITNLEYIFPVDVEVRKGSFGVFAHTLFWELKGGEQILGGLASANWNDKGYWIDTGLSYELASWKLTDEPGGPAVTLEPFAAARLVRDPVEVTLPISGTKITGFNSVSPIIGLRTFWDLDEHWNLRVEGDYGGFGVDDNRRTWQAVGLIGYRWRGWGTSWNLQVGYRATTLFKLEVPGGTVRQEARGPNIVFSVEL